MGGINAYLFRKQIQVQFKKSEEIGGQAKCLLLSSRSGIFKISKCLKRPLWFKVFFEFCFRVLNIFFVFFCFFWSSLRGNSTGFKLPFMIEFCLCWGGLVFVKTWCQRQMTVPCHMDLRSIEVAIPSLRHWDLIGWDLDCCNREVSIEAIKHLERAFWNDCSNVNFESLLVQFGLEVLNVWEPFCAKNENWRFASCPTASGFCFVIIVWGDRSGSSRKRLERGGCSLASQIQAPLQARRI